MIFSIESSCDDSSVALTCVDSKKLIYHRSISQHEHSTYGGVVPELAGRMFARDLPLLLRGFLDDFTFDGVKAVAVTFEPGLSISLMEGAVLAKSIAISYSLPLIGVNHLNGHVYSLFIGGEAVSPMSVLLVSGGHTMILEYESYRRIQTVSSTLDDSFGECLDKAARLLNLGYPGGMLIDGLAQRAVADGIQDDICFPIPFRYNGGLNFSFSGLKNAFRLQVERLMSHRRNLINGDLRYPIKQKLALALQNASVGHLYRQVEKYLKRNVHVKNFAVVGGASSNTFLRKDIASLCDEFGLNLFLPPLEFCSDNAAMIGRGAIDLYNAGDFSDLSLQVNPRVISKRDLIHKGEVRNAK